MSLISEKAAYVAAIKTRMPMRQRGAARGGSRAGIVIMIAMMAGACSSPSAPRMAPVGPNVIASVVVMFEAGTSGEDVRRFVLDYLSEQSSPLTGDARAITCDVLRVAPFQNPYARYMVAITFCPTAPEERREAAVAAFAGAPHVAKVARDASPSQVVP